MVDTMKGPIAKEELKQDSCSTIDEPSYEYCPLSDMVEIRIRDT